MSSNECNRLAEDRVRTARHLLRLLSEEERTEICREFTLPEVATAEELTNELASLPRFRALQFVLAAAEPTLAILKDITEFLEYHGVAARTTGCVFLLGDPVQDREERVELSAQAARAVSEWTPKARKRLSSTSFQDIETACESLEDGWRQLISASRPRRRRGDMDVVETFIQGSIVYEPDIDLTDRRAQEILWYLVDHLEDLITFVDRVPRDALPGSLRRLRRDMEEIVDAAEEHLLSDPYGRKRREAGEHPDKPEAFELERYVGHEFLDAFDRLSEDLKLLGDIIEDESIFDVIALSLWTSRPQLFEVWLLADVLRWLGKRGYQVDLQKLTRTEGGRIEWQLRYARERDPCALVTSQDARYGVFFQIYQATGDMPDLCLMALDGSKPTPLWTIDAKHSERGGYSLASYRTTAQRYRQSLGAPLSIVAEYFSRSDLQCSRPQGFGNGVFLVTDCNPGGTGIPALHALLADLHPQLAATLVCIDFSDSFKKCRLPALRRLFQQVKDSGESLHDTMVCVAGNAAEEPGLTRLMRTEGIHLTEFQPNLSGGTQLGPLVHKLRELAATIALTRIVVLTDGEFSDTQTGIEDLKKELKIPIVFAS